MYRYICPLIKSLTIVATFYPKLVHLDASEAGGGPTCSLGASDIAIHKGPLYPDPQFRALRLISFAPGKVKIQTSALNSVLDKVGDKPFAIYSINGPSRTGKSYLLTKCLEYLQRQQERPLQGICDTYREQVEKIRRDEFEWRGSSDRCTRGINVWPDPIDVTLKNGKRIAVILMDCQGCFDSETPMSQDAKVFAVSTLLSSVQIFNVMKTIDEATLQFLEAFTGIASMAKASAPANKQKDFQKLLILIRDFQFRDYKLGYYDDNTAPAGETKNYKMDKLNPQTNQPEELQHVRDTILESFEETAVYLMPYPGNSLTMDDNVEDLDKRFEDYQNDLIELLFSPERIVLKTVDGLEVTGTEFKGTVERLAQIFETQEFPDLKRCAEANSELQYLIAIQAARDEYKKSMTLLLDGSKFKIPEEELSRHHNFLIETAYRVFSGKFKLRKNENEARFRDELSRRAGEMFSEFLKVNSERWNMQLYYLQKTWEKVMCNWHISGPIFTAVFALIIKSVCGGG